VEGGGDISKVMPDSCRQESDKKSPTAANSRATVITFCMGISFGSGSKKKRAETLHRTIRIDRHQLPEMAGFRMN
jgi:hypothetical protein